MPNKGLISSNAANNPNRQAPWPVRQGLFRSTGQSDFVPQRTPSPIVEMPNTPIVQSSTSSAPSASPMSPRAVTVVDVNPLSPTTTLLVGSLPSVSSSPASKPASPSVVVGSPLAGGPPSPKKLRLKSRMLTPINVSIREIPIEVQQEVYFECTTVVIVLLSFYISLYMFLYLSIY